MLYPAFVGGSYPSQAVTADAERTVNWYFERMEVPGATSRSALYPTPGVQQVSEASVAPPSGGRAHFFQDGREFAVIGPTLYEIDITGVLTSRGTVGLDVKPATISSNGDGGGQLFITSGGNGFILNLSTNVLTQVAALNGRADMGDMLDGFFLALDVDSSTLLISNLLNGLVWNTGTDFAQRSIQPDPWIGMKVMNRYIYLFGEQTSEVWYNVGATFPFAPHPSGLIQYGISAPFSAAVIDAALVWLGASAYGDSFVLRTTGFTPEVISTSAVQKVFSLYSDLSDAVADTYNDLGHSFYVLSFPSQLATWAWDTQSGVWHERGTWIAEEARYVDWRPRWHAQAFGEHRMLDASAGFVYRMRSDLTSDVEGRVIRRLRRAPAMMAEDERIYYASFELDLEPGLGTPTGQGSNPQVMMRQSKDGGKTWGSERLAGAGKVGQYFTRVNWHRCGQGRRMVFEVSVSDPIPWRVTNAYLKLGQPVRVESAGRAQTAAR